MSIICFTGHRPASLGWGYDYTDSRWVALKNRIKETLIDINCTHAISGMALGVDTVAALAVLELKSEGRNIWLGCAIPCQKHSSRWTNESKKLYDSILSLADKVHLVSDSPYSASLMQIRNEFMVDKSDLVIAVYNGNKSGGTANCVRYAKSVGKEIIIINPGDFS